MGQNSTATYSSNLDKMLPFFVLLGCFCAVSSIPSKSYDGYSVYRVVPDTEQQLQYLRGLENNPTVSFWRDPSRIGRDVDLMVMPSFRHDVWKSLEDQGMKPEVLTANVQDLINAEAASMQAQSVTSSDREFSLNTYHSHAEVDAWLDELAAQYPDIAQVETIGQSFEGRVMKIIKIGKDASKPAVWIDGGIHAREWISPATLNFMLHELLSKYTTDPSVRNLVDNVYWYFLPMHNPDGYEYSRNHERLWRKTRQPPTSGNCIGVDPNRNWSYKWMEAGASSFPCSDIYAGPQPFSEPETKAVADYVTPIKNSVKVFLTFHSYSQLWLPPFGYKTNTYPENYAEQVALGVKCVNALKAVHGTSYGKVESSADSLYPAAGASDDWAANLGIPFVYTVELRDRGRYGFIAPSSEIVPSGEETFAAIKAVGDHVIAMK